MVVLVKALFFFESGLALFGVGFAVAVLSSRLASGWGGDLEKIVIEIVFLR